MHIPTINQRLRASILTGAAVLVLGLSWLPAPHASADESYDPSLLMSDSIFFDYSSMTASDIQSFLVSEGSGLQNYSAVEDCGSTSDPYYSYVAQYYSCGQTELASKIIYDASQAYGVNPRVVLATMQKEQSLATTPDPTTSQLNCAMGYLSCSSSVSGFFLQVDNATWQFRAYYENMNGNAYWGLSAASYPCAHANSLYSNGLYPGNTVTFTDPGGTAETVTLSDSSTAALYCYTPYVGPYSQTGYSGSYNFVISYEEWWGSVTGDTIGTTLYMLWNPKTYKHYYTAIDSQEATAQESGWDMVSTDAFPISATQQSGMIPIYALYNGRLNDNWLVSDGMAYYWGLIFGGYANEGVAFYAYPASPTGSVQACAQGTPVYQMWQGGHTDHFYSINGGDRYWSLIYGGYIDDGSGIYQNPNIGSVSFCAPSS